MSPRQRKRFEDYFRLVADRMGLRDWEVVIHDRPPEDGDALATVLPTHGRRSAVIRLAPDFGRLTPVEQRHAAVHELCHCHLEPAWMIAIDAMPAKVHPAFERMAEYGLDALAVTLAEHMPLPY